MTNPNEYRMTERQSRRSLDAARALLSGGVTFSFLTLLLYPAFREGNFGRINLAALFLLSVAGYLAFTEHKETEKLE